MFSLHKKLIKFQLSFIIKKFFISLKIKPYVISRTACLGNEIQDLVFPPSLLRVNFQKSRVDHIINDNQFKVPLYYGVKQIRRSDIWHSLYMQTRSIFEFYVKPKCIILDSYSELTDQEFNLINSNRKLTTNYSDLDLQTRKNKFVCNGLINLDDLERSYHTFFSKIKSQYGDDTPIFFINFSTSLDPRYKFKQRGKLIKEVIDKIQATGKYNLHVITLDDNHVEQANQDRFYYHFSKDTYDMYAEKFRVALFKFDKKRFKTLVKPHSYIAN